MSSSDCREYITQSNVDSLLIVSLANLTLEVSSQRSLFTQVLDVASVWEQRSSFASGNIVITSQLGETPLVGHNNLLSAWKLVLCTAQGLVDNGTVVVAGADGDHDLLDVDTGHGSSWFSVRTSHASLQSIGTSTTQHLVDSDDVEGMDADTHVEGVLSG